MSQQPGAATPALARLQGAGVDHAVRTYVHDEATSDEIGFGKEAAAALGMDEAQIFKTLMVDAGGEPLLAVVPVSSQLDLKALARAIEVKKVALSSPEVAERVTGSVVGGISPIAGRTPLPVVIDESAGTYATVVVSAGRRGVNVELATDDLIALTSARVAAIAR